MGDVRASGATSLERLKNLDAVPTFEAQIDEATKLCTHSARAEMIFRWIIEKLKTAPEKGCFGSCWTLISSAIRLLPPRRIAVLLHAATLSDILLATLSQPGLTRSSSKAIRQFLDLLLSIGDSPEGSPVKAILSVDGAKAATFCGAWFRLILQQCCINCQGQAEDQGFAYLDVSLQIWDLRKKQSEDDICFAQHCLVPALEILSILRSNAPTGNSKRGRENDTADGLLRYQLAFSSLLARHCILPARNAFRRNRNSTSWPSRNSADASGSDDSKAFLKALDDQLQGSPSEQLLAGVPNLLEVMIQSVPTPSPRHRDLEQPWWEHFFSSLLDCFRSSGIAHATRNTVVVDMLKTMNQYGSLSTEKLAHIVRHYAIGETIDKTHQSLQVISEVIHMNAGLFMDPALAELLFDTVSKGSEFEASATLMDHILKPVMTAYASGRSMPQFVTLWKTQFLQEGNDPENCIWAQLCAPFSELLESSLSTQQILDLISDTQGPMIDSKPLEDAATFQQLRVSFILLSAILAGIRGDSLVDQMHSKLDDLFRMLLAMPRAHSEQHLLKLGSSFWKCLTQLFNLWYPLWTTQQTDPNVARRMAQELVSNEKFNAALALYREPSIVGATFTTTKASVQAAGLYVATICNAVSSFEEDVEVNSTCKRTIQDMSTAAMHALPSFILFPNLLCLLDASERQGLLRETFAGISRASLDGQIALISSIALHTTPDLREDMIKMLIESLNTAQSKPPANSGYSGLLMGLLTIPSDDISKTQRHTLVDILLNPASSQLKAWAADQAQCHFALLLHLIKAASVQVSNYIDLKKLWTLAGDIDGNAPQLLTASHETRCIFETIARQVIHGWLNRHLEGKAHETIISFSQDIRPHINHWLDGSSGAKSGLSMIVKVFLEKLQDKRFVELTLSMELQDSQIAKASLKAGSKEMARVSHQLAQASNGHSTVDWEHLHTSFERMRTISSGSSTKITKYRQQLAEASLEILETLTLDSMSSEKIRAVIECLHIAVDVSEDMDLRLSVASRLLLHQTLDACERDAVILAFTKAFERSSAGARKPVLLDLFNHKQSQSVAHLVLQHAAVVKLMEEDVNLLTENELADVLVNTISIIDTETSVPALRGALRNTNTILREKAFLVNQYGVEHVMSNLQKLAARSVHVAAFFAEICQTITLLLTQYRSRIRDRHHLTVALLSSLLSRFFPTVTDRKNTWPALSAHHAATFARVLVVLCNRRANDRHRTSKKTSELVDEARKVQARTGQYVQFVLHRYCALVLTGTPGEGVREALVPGIWAIIEAIEVNGPEAIKALSAAMNHSERAVLRSVYDDWKRFGKWEGL